MSSTTPSGGGGSNNTTNTNTTLFESTSIETPQILHVSFANDPTASLGVQLINCDTPKHETSSMFCPGYAIVGKLLDNPDKSPTIAQMHNVQIGDVIVAVNGHGFRRFALDSYTPSNMNDYVITGNVDSSEISSLVFDHEIATPGTAYQNLLAKIKAVKSAEGKPPLVVTLERYGWDNRVHNWHRFLTARDNQVQDAMVMWQQHDNWRSSYFPIQLKSSGLQRILHTKAVSEIDHACEIPTTVYVNYGILQNLLANNEITHTEIVQAFVLFTERMLYTESDVRKPKFCQFIDLSGVSSLSPSAFQTSVLKQIYSIFEPNYPETLYKMVIYPVSSIMATTARTLLSFVNEKTKNKFLITNDLDLVCQQLHWDKAEVEECGGITEFMHKHEKAGNTLLVPK